MAGIKALASSSINLLDVACASTGYITAGVVGDHVIARHADAKYRRNASYLEGIG